MDKAPEAFRTISEVADELDVPQHVLRFWETRFPQIKPMKRGGGRRYYRPDDVELLRGIRHLLYGQGYTIRGVQVQIKEKGLKFVQGIWKQSPPPADSVSRQKEEVETGEQPAFTAEPARDGKDTSAPMRREGGTRVLSRANISVIANPQPATELPSSPPSAPIQSAASAGPDVADLQRLREALAELEECKRILSAALKEPE